MFPPTIIATPNSANARLKPAKTASITPPEASLRIAIDAWISVEPNVIARSLISESMDSTALVMKLTSMGVIRNACPILINKGVKRRPNEPTGPDLENSKKSMRPSITVGNPIKALNDPWIKRLPRKFFKPKIAAIGKLQSVAIATAKPDTYNDRKTIRYTVGSREKRSWNPWIIPSNIGLDN